jgi:hypothetical protein
VSLVRIEARVDMQAKKLLIGFQGDRTCQFWKRVSEFKEGIT